ncbi:MAG: autotransporter-associated beta strand repeat-containing protein, partial [Thermoguttaceae bacterium]
KVDLGNDTNLIIALNSQTPCIEANQIAIGSNVSLDVIGVFDNMRDFVVLKSNSAISGDFAKKPSFNTADYLTASFDFNDATKTQYLAKVGLRWNSTNPALPAHGTFTLNENESFIVGIGLGDKTTNLDSSWDGTTLTKKGIGTLILDAANTYTGATNIEAGTILLKNERATAGSTGVVVSEDASLALDFTGNYATKISGEGQLVKQGASTTTLTGTKANEYSGGTLLKDGVLAISADNQLGDKDGAVSFAGGTLRITGTNVVLNHAITMQTGKDAILDITEKAQITSEISGSGNVRKTGIGTLYLNGTAKQTGKTIIEKGTLALSNSEAIGAAGLVMHDGTTLSANDNFELKRNIVIEAPATKTLGTGVIIDATNNSIIVSGTISGAAQLVKTGGNQLKLAAKNTYSGGTLLKDGVLVINNKDNLGTGELIFDGGILSGSAALIQPLNINMSVTAGKNFQFDTAQDMAISSDLHGSGGLVKLGNATLKLTGKNDYTGDTLVQSGILRVDGSTYSKTIVKAGAGLTGSGTIYNNVEFMRDSEYVWTMPTRPEDAVALNVRGNVAIANGAKFVPITSGAASNYPSTFETGSILNVAGTVSGKFTEVDNKFSPFYDFVLDYSNPHKISAIGYNRRTPRSLSDGVATALMIAQRQGNRRAFEQIDTELRDGRLAAIRQAAAKRNATTNRGQNAPFKSSLWGGIQGRTTQFASTFFDSDWSLNSFGVQGGYTCLSAPWYSLGLMFGVETPEIKNDRDKVSATDGYFGIYYGQRFYGLYEIKAYIGAGVQQYKSTRNDPRYTYRANYRGNSFQTNLELARPFLLGNLGVRPYFAFDVENVAQNASVEDDPLYGTGLFSEYRSYAGSSITQTFVRVGLDLEKQYEKWDNYFGISYSNLMAGDTTPNVGVYYPAVQAGTTSYGANLGHNAFTLKVGGTRYLDDAKNQSLFMNLISDIYSDRAGRPWQVSGAIGYAHRF